MIVLIPAEEELSRTSLTKWSEVNLTTLAERFCAALYKSQHRELWAMEEDWRLDVVPVCVAPAPRWSSHEAPRQYETTPPCPNGQGLFSPTPRAILHE